MELKKDSNIDDNELSKTIYSYNYQNSSIESENKMLQETVKQMKTQIQKLTSRPLMIAEVQDVVGDGFLIRIPNGNQFSVNSLCKEKISSGDSVLVEQRNLTIIKKIKTTKDFNVEKFVIMEKPNLKFEEIGGLSEQIKEIKEVIELPLKRPNLFKKVGIQPPKGILLYGEPGTGKTLLAKAVANSTNATFIEIVGSELVQKFIGEGAKLVKEVFTLAKNKVPSIIFIDELDALASKRIEVGTSGEREVQRTFMQLLAEIDGFKNLGKVKIIGCTNRKDILDPAILRPGRLDRLIEVPLPDKKGRKQIFKIHTKKMTLENIDFDFIVKKTENLSGAEIRAICTEAGYFAIRAKRSFVKQSDFVSAIEKIKNIEEHDNKDYVDMFG